MTDSNHFCDRFDTNERGNIVKEINGAPSAQDFSKDIEVETLFENKADYSEKLMYSLLTELTPVELAMKEGKTTADYDYGEIKREDGVFECDNMIHVLRHFKYDKHEPHTHEFFELICQVCGESVVNISSEKINFRRGSIYILSPGTEHCIENVNDDAILLKVFLKKTDFDDIYRQIMRSDTLLSRFFSGALYSENGGWLSFEAGDDNDVTDLLLRMRYHEVRSSPTDPVMKEALVMQLFCRLVDKHIESAKTSTNTDRVVKIISAIRADFRNITLEEVSERFHFSPGYISRIVKRATGMSFTELTEVLKLEHAEKLLRLTDLSIDDVATGAGFGCREFFHRKFKEKYSLTPSKYRKKCREGEV